jgi:hypothetical protein
MHGQPKEPTSLLSTPRNGQHRLGGLNDNNRNKTSPVTSVSKTSSIESAQVRADPVFQDIVRNAKASTVHAETVIHDKGSVIKIPSKIGQRRLNAIGDGLGDHIGVARSKTTPVKTAIPVLTRNSTLFVGPDMRLDPPIGSFRPTPVLLEQQKSSEKYSQTHDATVDGDADVANIHTQPELTSPARSPPSPPMALSPFTSRVSPILTPTCIPDHYDYDTPSVFEETLHQVVTKSNSPGEWSKQDGAGTSMPAARSSHRCSCDPVKRKPNSHYRSSRATPQAGGTTSRSTLKSAMTGQSQTTISTEQSVSRNKDVFKGLQIALAAACDEDMDAWITEVSGCRVRCFLADLRVFEGLGVNALVEETMRTARRRRRKMEAYRARVGTDYSEIMDVPCPAHDGDTGIEKETRKGRSRDFKMGFVASDTSARRTAL